MKRIRAITRFRKNWSYSFLQTSWLHELMPDVVLGTGNRIKIILLRGLEARKVR